MFFFPSLQLEFQIKLVIGQLIKRSSNLEQDFC
jgi:hypothetical protein